MAYKILKIMFILTMFVAAAPFLITAALFVVAPVIANKVSNHNKPVSVSDNSMFSRPQVDDNHANHEHNDVKLGRSLDGID